MKAKERNDEFIKAVSSGDWKKPVTMFAALAAQHDRLDILVDALLIQKCNGNEREAEVLKIGLLNQIAEEQRRAEELQR